MAFRLTARSPDGVHWTSVSCPKRSLRPQKHPESVGSGCESLPRWPGGAVFHRGGRSCLAAFVEFGSGSRSRAYNACFMLTKIFWKSELSLFAVSGRQHYSSSAYSRPAPNHARLSDQDSGRSLRLAAAIPTLQRRPCGKKLPFGGCCADTFRVKCRTCPVVRAMAPERSRLRPDRQSSSDGPLQAQRGSAHRWPSAGPGPASRA